MKRKIVCERAGKAITLAWQRPYWIQDVEGLGALEVDVESEKQTDYDGEIYRGAAAAKRNIVITATVIPPEGRTHADIREEFLAFFVPRESGTLYYFDAGVEPKKIEYQTEKVEFEMDGVFRKVKISLLCLDPTFKGEQDDRVEMASVVGLIEWPVELTGPFEVGIKEPSRMASVVNPSSVDRGMTITFRAAGEVVHPALTEVSRQQTMRILTTMHDGDEITVTTGPGNKRVRLRRNGTEQDINNLWEFGGTWLQVCPGENIFAYSAESGEDALEIILKSTPAFWGV